MPINIEIKAKIKNYQEIKALAEKISDTPGEIIKQEDTFFNSKFGRLKLRKLGDSRGELIYYDRENTLSPKPSNYKIYSTKKPDALKQILIDSFGIRGIVKKERLLFMVGNTRIHLDKVDGLGDFMELEVVLAEGQTMEEGQQIAKNLMVRLKINKDDLIDVAYIDMLESKLRK